MTDIRHLHAALALDPDRWSARLTLDPSGTIVTSLYLEDEQAQVRSVSVCDVAVSRLPVVMAGLLADLDTHCSMLDTNDSPDVPGATVVGADRYREPRVIREDPCPGPPCAKQVGPDNRFLTVVLTGAHGQYDVVHEVHMALVGLPGMSLVFNVLDNDVYTWVVHTPRGQLAEVEACVAKVIRKYQGDQGDLRVTCTREPTTLFDAVPGRVVDRQALADLVPNTTLLYNESAGRALLRYDELTWELGPSLSTVQKTAEDAGLSLVYYRNRTVEEVLERGLL